MTDETVPNVIQEATEVLRDAVITIVEEAAPGAVKEALANAPEVIKETIAAAAPVIRETVAQTVAQTPEVIDEATRVYEYVFRCLVYTSLVLALCIVLAWRLFGARVAALVAAPARPPPSSRRRLLASMGDAPPRDAAQTWHAPAKEKRRTLLDAHTFDKEIDKDK